MLVLLI